MKIKPYSREINYYETDKMQIVHHSNYARFYEECRLDMMKQIGIPYDKLEEMGIVIPVLEVHSIFRYSIKYGDTILIYPKLEKLSAVRFSVKYRVEDAFTGQLKHQAESVHCFVDDNFRPLNLKRNFPEIYAKFESLLDTEA